MSKPLVQVKDAWQRPCKWLDAEEATRSSAGSGFYPTRLSIESQYLPADCLPSSSPECQWQKNRTVTNTTGFKFYAAQPEYWTVRLAVGERFLLGNARAHKTGVFFSREFYSKVYF